MGRGPVGGTRDDARRPPELSTRDNVARAIYTEVKEGRGSPHGGVFLDISYLPPETVRRKLPSMYEQFKELADVDITTGPMEVGPTTHYVMGGIQVDADTGATAVAGPVRRGRGGRRHARREPARRQLAVRPARVRGADRARPPRRTPPTPASRTWTRSRSRPRSAALGAPLERDEGEDPYAIQRDLQEMMQRLVGIFRVEADLDEALAGLAELRRRWTTVRATGGRTYNPGWNLVFELDHLLTVSEAIARSARQRTESRGAHSRLDYPATDDAHWGTLNIVVSRDLDGSMAVDDRAAAADARRAARPARSGDH